MAARFLDMALDDVAKSRSTDTRGPGNRRGGATRGGNTGRDSPARNNRSSPYSRNSPDDKWTHDKFDEGQKSGRAGGSSSSNNNSRNARAPGNEGNAKIIVENLHYAVTLEDIKVLFETHAGPVKFAEVKYDLSGRSTGVATILFKVPSDAGVAIKKLNGIALDGQSMKIEYAPAPPPRRDDRRAGSSRDGPRGDVFSRLGSSEASIASRLGKANPLPKQSGAQGGQSRSGHGSGRSQTKPQQPKQTRQQTKPKTVEELDAEMDTYMGDA